MTDAPSPLQLTDTGRGSREDLIEYVRTVIEQRTVVNDDTTADRLARAIVTSILARLGADHSGATGSGLSVAEPAETRPTDHDNNIMVAGYLLAILSTATDLDPWVDMATDECTNTLTVAIPFMNSRYRITVERAADP